MSDDKFGYAGSSPPGIPGLCLWSRWARDRAGDVNRVSLGGKLGQATRRIYRFHPGERTRESSGYVGCVGQRVGGFCDHSALHRRHRLAHQLVRPDHAVPTRRPARGARAATRRDHPPDAAQGAGDPGAAPRSARLAGDRAGAGGQDGVDRRRQGHRQDRHRARLLRAPRPARDRRPHRHDHGAQDPEHRRQRDEQSAPGAVEPTCPHACGPR